MLRTKEEGSRSSPRSHLRLLLKLELHAEGELKLTRSARRSQAADGSIGFDVAARIAWVDVIESVECVHAELHCNAFVDRERLGESQIVVEVAGSKIRVAANVADRIQSGVLEDPCTWISQQVACLLLIVGPGTGAARTRLEGRQTMLHSAMAGGITRIGRSAARDVRRCFAVV